MSNLSKHTFQPKTLDQLLDANKAFVVIDTNVLLAAYQWKEVTITKIMHALETLAQERRLIIPAHVVDEFTKNRPGLIAAMIQSVDQELSKSINLTPLRQVAPTLHDTVELMSAEESLSKVNTALKDYKNHLRKVRDKLVSLFDHDPVFYGGPICQDKNL